MRPQVEPRTEVREVVGEIGRDARRGPDAGLLAQRARADDHRVRRRAEQGEHEAVRGVPRAHLARALDPRLVVRDDAVDAAHEVREHVWRALRKAQLSAVPFDERA